MVDVYGRFVGDILISAGGNELNINDWMLENGWAFRTFYESMMPAEITRMTTAAKKAETHNLGIWKFYTSTIGVLDWNLVFRRTGPPLPEKDRGPVIFPKLFRRLCVYGVKVKTQNLKGSFTTFLANLKPQDYCHLTSDFLKTGPAKATQKRLSQFVTTQFKARPDGLVLSEKLGTIVDAQNKPIKFNDDKGDRRGVSFGLSELRQLKPDKGVNLFHRVEQDFRTKFEDAKIRKEAGHSKTH